MSFANRVRQRRKDLGLSQAELAERIGIAQQSINKIETGVTLKPRNIVQLAEALECDPAWLLTGKRVKSDSILNVEDDLPADAISLYCLKRIPIISQVQAGAWGGVNPRSFLDDDIEWQVTTMNVGDNAFAMKVTGNSMTNPHGSPSIPAGSIVIVEPCSSPDNGKIVVATLNDSPEATIKKLEIDGPHRFLVPLNPKYDPIPINGNCRIVGYVKQVIMDL
ncbi:LexA family transcriptional repressor [Vibrio navarrensis]|uniref:LexA family protein n=1 Tax=Vibrio navarrensis TaxID=29495 RepID=UPI001869744A|nr:LexA family transcriptional regulator [Vibrio navarrensis]MBE4575508.1 LexA family transcriptional repressor [Vibrio navarrensis]